MLIDYEVAATDYRGCDLAAFIISSMIGMKDDGTFHIICEWPDDNYRRMIFTEYLNETRKLDYFEFDANGVDSVEHVMMEVDFFVLYGLQLLKGFFKTMPNNDFFQQQPEVFLKNWLVSYLSSSVLMILHLIEFLHFQEFIPVMGRMYATYKNNFIDKYSKNI